MKKSYIYIDNNYNTAIQDCKVFEVVVKNPSRVISAPIETGQRTFDNKVLDPREITVTGMCANNPCAFSGGAAVVGGEAKNVFKAMWKNRKFNFYSLTSPEAAYKNLILKDYTTKSSADRIDWTEYTLVFVEALLIQSRSEKKPANPEHGGSNNKGVVSGS